MSCRFLAKLLFVLIFLVSAGKNIMDPTPFSALLIDRFERFQNLAKLHNFEAFASFISLDSLKHQADQISKVVGIGQIVISVGILSNLPYISVFFSLFLVSTIALIHNPLYFEDRERFFAECGNAILEIGMIGIALIFATSPDHEHQEEGTKKRKKKAASQNINDESNVKNEEKKKKKIKEEGGVKAEEGSKKKKKKD